MSVIGRQLRRLIAMLALHAARVATPRGDEISRSLIECAMVHLATSNE